MNKPDMDWLNTFLALPKTGVAIVIGNVVLPVGILIRLEQKKASRRGEDDV